MKFIKNIQDYPSELIIIIGEEVSIRDLGVDLQTNGY